jgi:hypothetical protein
MTSEVRPAGVTFSSPAIRILVIVFVVPGGALAALLPWGGSWPPWAAAAYLGLVAIVAAGVLYWSFRLGVRFDDHGITIRGIFGTDRYGWPEVSRLTDGRQGGGEGPDAWALNVVLADGRTVTVHATARNKSASPKVLAVIRQIADRYQIPAELTGTAMTAEGLPGARRTGSSGGQALDEVVEDRGHLRAGLGAVCGFGDVKGGLIAGSHQYVRERHHGLGADAPEFDPLRQEHSHQSEDV